MVKAYRPYNHEVTVLLALLGLPLLTFLGVANALGRLPLPRFEAQRGFFWSNSVPTVGTPDNPLVLQPTHRALCPNREQGLNLRQQAGFTAVKVVIPCQQGVVVTGNPIARQNEQWSPVTYGKHQGWVATRYLQKL
ncbi:MAG: SH3 domain-containing protein [Synechococcales bacterium]|nr:SH3 domain-containing protein [Synechococcales bacterium]